MRSRWNLPIYLFYTVICVIALLFIVVQMGIVFPWNHPYTVTAAFRSGAGILANNEVLMNGTKVGRIKTVEPQGGQAVVTMFLENPNAQPLYQDATAQVRIKNLLGETYVELSRGSDTSHPMRDGGQIPMDHTITPVEIDQVLAVLDPQTRDRLQLLINGAGDALANRGSNLNSQAHTVNNLFTELNGPAALLSARQQQIDAVVLELQRFYDTLAAQRDQVRDEFTTWNDVMAQMAAQEQQIGGTVQQADVLLQNIDTVVTGEVPNIRGTLQALAPALTSTSAFLTSSNTILQGVLPFRRSIHDVFPDLGTSFQDIDATTGQHIWSVFAVDCGSDCSTTASTTGPTDGGVWTTAMGGTG